MSEGDPHYLGHRQRLSERFLKSGFEGFANYEVVELLLTLAIPRSDVKQPAKALIARFGNLRAILDAPIEELQAVKGLGSVTPVALKIIKAAATLFQVADLDSGYRLLHDGVETLEERTIDRASDYIDYWAVDWNNDTSQAFDVEVK